MNRTSRAPRIAGGIAIVFGALTIVSGGTALLGAIQPNSAQCVGERRAAATASLTPTSRRRLGPIDKGSRMRPTDDVRADLTPHKERTARQPG
jgi:hypothetical protein